MIVLRRVPSKCFTSKVVDCGGSPFGPPRAFGQLTVKLALEPVTVEVMDNPLESRVGQPASIEAPLAILANLPVPNSVLPVAVAFRIRRQ